MLPESTLLQAEDVLAAYRARGWMIATAESCTGGLIGAALTAIAGSSDVVDRGFITYSNEAKTEMLGVSASLIGRVGAVSEQVAMEMAVGALAALNTLVHVAPPSFEEKSPVPALFLLPAVDVVMAAYR